MAAYIFKVKDNPVGICFYADYFPTFCGGAIISGIHILGDHQPHKIAEKRLSSKWKDLTQEMKEEFMEGYYECVEDILRKFTSYLNYDKGWRTIEDSGVSGVFTMESELCREIINGKHTGRYERVYTFTKIPRDDAGLTRRFFIIADAINGESNNPLAITTWNLAMSSNKWRAVSEVPVINFNSSHYTNVWVLTADGNSLLKERATFEESPFTLSPYDNLLQRGVI